jgi:hypothetical protein
MSLLNRPIRVVIAKAGLDGHERGAHAVTTMLRDAGMETIGPRWMTRVWMMSSWSSEGSSRWRTFPG